MPINGQANAKLNIQLAKMSIIPSHLASSLIFPTNLSKDFLSIHCMYAFGLKAVGHTVSFSKMSLKYRSASV